MDTAERLAIARKAMLEGDLETGERIVDAVLVRDPADAEARRMRGLLRAIVSENAGIPTEALGDLRPDTRHLEWSPPEDDPLPLRSPPFGVAVLAGLTVATGATGAIVGLVLLLAGAPVALVLLALGLLETGAGIGLWRLRGWAWYVSVVALGLGVALNAFAAARGSIGSLAWGLVQLALLIYLARVSPFFLGRPGSRAPSAWAK